LTTNIANVLNEPIVVKLSKELKRWVGANIVTIVFIIIIAVRKIKYKLDIRDKTKLFCQYCTCHGHLGQHDTNSIIVLFLQRVAKESMAGIIEMQYPTVLPTSIANVNEPLVVKLSKELDRKAGATFVAVAFPFFIAVCKIKYKLNGRDKNRAFQSILFLPWPPWTT
jgi:hypothetical protein